MLPFDESLDVYECPLCSDLGVSIAESFCEDQVEPVETPDLVSSPDTETVFREFFGIPEGGLTVCRTVIAEGETTVNSLAKQLGRNRSTINRHLNQLAELGIVEKQPQTLPDGGQRFVYSPIPDLQRQFKLGLYSWLSEALVVIGGLGPEQSEEMAKMQADSKSGNETDENYGIDSEPSGFD